MRLIGLMPVRNEDWCLGLSARVALMWCDSLVILLHACTDRSADIAYEIAKEYSPRVAVVTDEAPMWNEMGHRQGLLECARSIGATHIAMIDADEVLTADLIGTNIGQPIRQHVAAMPGNILHLPGYNLRGSLDRYHANGIWSRRWFATAFQDDPALNWCGDRFHQREPVGRQMGTYRPVMQGQGGVMHLWGASERRLRAKHSLYKLTEALRWPERPREEIDRMYSLAIKGNLPHDPAEQWVYAKGPDVWWEPYAHLMKYLDVDAEPWQEAESRRLVALHGAERFAGLDLFGVV